MYEKLSQQDSNECSDSPLSPKRINFHSVLDGTFCLRFPRSIFTLERLIILALLAIITACLPLVITSRLFDRQTKIPIQKFGGNTDYMTLDHKADLLWENLVVNDTSGHGGLV